jgi:hypothetical protein
MTDHAPSPPGPLSLKGGGGGSMGDGRGGWGTAVGAGAFIIAPRGADPRSASTHWSPHPSPTTTPIPPRISPSTLEGEGAGG